jgi:EAL domain-containing protein (putative c-di-GMP-specific phosphodiesterase class I)
LSDSRLVEDMEKILIETGLNPSCLKLEMTESSIMGNADATLATLRRLKAMNLGLEIDDFGTGYSSLSCDYALGFYFSKPKSPGLVEEMMDASHDLQRAFEELVA